MAEKIFQYNLDGLSFEIRVFEDPDNAGCFLAEIKVISGFADFNAVYVADDTMSGASASIKGALNMNGAEGSSYEGEPVQWDSAQKLSDAGLGKLGADKPTYLTAGESMTIKLDGVTSLDSVEYLGIRATSTSTPAGSIKTVDQGELIDPPVPADDFPAWGQDISHVTFVFKQDAGDVKGGGGNGNNSPDGYYTVKIDGWDDQAPIGGDDLDTYIGNIIDYLIANDQFIFNDSTLCGVVIKGGLQVTNFYAYGDNNLNGTDPDPLPAGLGFTLNGTKDGEQPPNAIDTSYLYDDVFA